MARPLVIYHGGCHDGLTAAAIAYQYLEEHESTPELVGMQYGEPPPDVADRDVYIVDFSFKRPFMEIMIGQAEKLVVLDHHKTAQQELDGIPSNDRVSIVFDMERSGARMAWDHFYPGIQPPDMVLRVEDRDLWRWRYADTADVHAALASYPADPVFWADGLLYKPLRELSIEGSHINRFMERRVEDILQGARMGQLPDGTPARMIGCPGFLMSEVVGRLAETSPLGWAAGYFDTKDRRVYSLRSRGENGPDVSEIAKRFGGGGHRNAAGFGISLPADPVPHVAPDPDEDPSNGGFWN